MAWELGRRMAYRESPIFTDTLNVIPDTSETLEVNTVSGDSSLSGRSFRSLDFERDRLYCFTWSPNHEEHPG